MYPVRTTLKHLERNERVALIIFFALLVISIGGFVTILTRERTVVVPVHGGQWDEGVVGRIALVNPVIAETEADKDASALIYAPLSDLLQTYAADKTGTTYTVTLKEGLVWDDGKPLTSDDILFTLAQILDPNSHSPLQKNWQGIKAERVSELQVLVTLPKSYVFFVENLKKLRIIPKHIWGTIPLGNASSSRYAEEPVGDGPYTFERAKKDRDGSISDYALVVNEHYAGSTPYIKNFTFHFYPTDAAMVRAFQLREIDGFGLAVPPEDNTVPKSATIEKLSSSRYYAVFFNAAKNQTLGISDIRYALDRATPKDSITHELFEGRATPVDGPVLWENISGETASSSWNPDTARSLITQSGVTHITLTLTVPNTPYLVKTAELLKQNWEAAGVEKVTLRILDVNDAFNAIKNGDYEAVLFGSVLENPRDLYPFWHSSQIGYPGLNLSHFSNSAADALMEKVRTTMDEDTLRAELGSLHLTLTSQTPAVFLYSLPYLYVHNQNLKGFEAADNLLVSPDERFQNVAKWYVTTAVMLK